MYNVRKDRVFFMENKKTRQAIEVWKEKKKKRTIKE